MRRALENLESRITPAGPLVSFVLSGTSNTRINGSIFVDSNTNGIKDTGEDFVGAGFKVYLDLDQDGTRNTDMVGTLEPIYTTDTNGSFSIRNLQPGTYRVNEVLQTGWTATTTVAKDVVVAKNTTSNTTFGVFAGGDITGTVWNDENAAGIRAKDTVTSQYTDLGLTGWVVFLDLNTNQVKDAGEPSILTDADGKYSFKNLPPNDYEVTEIQPPNWDVSPTFDKHQTASVVGLKTVTQDFGNFSLLNGTLEGTVWNDLNGDGNRAIDITTGLFIDPGLSGWTVFLDLNSNGTLDGGEQTAITNASGNYAFASVLGGSYDLVEVLPISPSGEWFVAPGFSDTQLVTISASELTVADDFANFTVQNGSIRGTVWNDLNRNGIRDTNISGAFTDPGISGWSVYLDLNNNKTPDTGEPVVLTDAAGSYTFADLQIGDYHVREILSTGWETTATFDDNYTVTVFSGSESIAPDFANFNIAAAVPGSLSGSTWIDINGNGIRDVGTGGVFTDPGQGGRVVFVDTNGNGLLDTGELNATSAADDSFKITGVLPGTVTIVEQAKSGWNMTAPLTGSRTYSLKNAKNAPGLDFGSRGLTGSAIHGTVFFDKNQDSIRQSSERGLSGIQIYLDLNNNNAIDIGEPQTTTSTDQFFTPTIDEAGSYGFTHLSDGTYTVRFVLPVTLSATPAAQLSKSVTVGVSEVATGINCAAVFRSGEIHGKHFHDLNGNHKYDVGEPGILGKHVYIDLDRDCMHDVGEPETITDSEGKYTFTGLASGTYVVHEDDETGYEHTYPMTTAGTLWPAGVSNPAIGNVSPTSITTSLANGQSYSQNVSITLPNGGPITDMVDVFLLFDDTGSFVNNSPIVRAAFPTIMSQLQASLPSINLGFGVGRLEEYGNFGFEYATGRPFILNQPVVASSTPGYLAAIQAALNRTTPGYGGDQPDTDFEALYQLVTGLGFDGNNKGTTSDSGAAGLASTQLFPGNSGDVPSFASFTADTANNVMTPSGNRGGGGFRAGALPIILLSTDTGFAYQPQGETSITGVDGLTLPLSVLTQLSRPTTPFGDGAGIQQTITALNALGALVIGLGTNPQNNLDPRQMLSSISRLTGAINRSTTTIANGTPTPIVPDDPLYFQIASGLASSVANGVTSAIQNAATTVAVDIDVIASDPRVHIINHTGVLPGIASGKTATFDIEFVGDSRPYRFDLQFVRAGTSVVLGSIPVVLGTPINCDHYEFEDVEDGEIEIDAAFGSRPATTTTAPTITITGGTFAYDGNGHAATAAATGIGGVIVTGSFAFTYNGSATLPTAAGTYGVIASFTSTDPNYGNSTGTGTVTISAVPFHVSNVTVNNGDTQRARVTSVKVTFDQHITLPATPATAFQLLRHSDSAAVDLATSVDDSGTGTVVTQTFTGRAVDFGSLQDGRYDLTVKTASVSYPGGQFDGNNDGTGGDDYTLVGDPATNKLYRLFGDADGDGTVAANDFIQFRMALGGKSPVFDFAGDGAVAASDFIQFRLRFGGVDLGLSIRGCGFRSPASMWNRIGPNVGLEQHQQADEKG